MTSKAKVKRAIRQKAIAYSLSLVIEDVQNNGMNDADIEVILAELEQLGIENWDIAEVAHFLRRVVSINA